MNSFRKRINIYKFSLILSYSEPVLLILIFFLHLEKLNMDSIGHSCGVEYINKKGLPFLLGKPLFVILLL